MTQVYFPTDPNDGQRYPQPGDSAGMASTGGIVFEFDAETGSWNIVGPDNVATTDWVKAQFKDDSTALDKGYDLIAATNDITIDANYSYDKSSDIYNTLLESGIRGDVLGDNKDYEESLEFYLIEWEDNNVRDNTPGGGALSVAGIDKAKLDRGEDSDVFSTEYQNIVELLVNDYDRDNLKADWLNNNGVGDTIELNFLGSTGQLEYALYNVKSKRQVPISTVDPNGDNKEYGALSNNWAIRVEYQASSNPSQKFRTTTASTYYSLKVFKKAFTAEGGVIEGPLHVIYKGEDAFMVKGTGEFDEQLLTVDTINNDVYLNQEHDLRLDYPQSGNPGSKSDTSVVTLGHLNRRLGTDSVDSVTQGPYFRQAGGATTGEERVIIGQENGVSAYSPKTFTIRGKSSSSNNGDLLTVVKGDSSRTDYVLLNIDDNVKTNNNSRYDNALLTKKQIKSLVSGETGDFVKKSGDTMSGSLTINGSVSNNKHAVTVEWVENRPLIIPTSNPGDAGALWSSNGVLYWNKR